MSYAEIESELGKLTPDELRRLAVKSWSAFMDKEGRSGSAGECDESDPRLLAALDEAITQANAAPDRGHSGGDVRVQLNEWTSK